MSRRRVAIESTPPSTLRAWEPGWAVRGDAAHGLIGICAAAAMAGAWVLERS